MCYCIEEDTLVSARYNTSLTYYSTHLYGHLIRSTVPSWQHHRPAGKAVHCGSYLLNHKKYKCKWSIRLNICLLYWYLTIKTTCCTQHAEISMGHLCLWGGRATIQYVHPSRRHWCNPISLQKTQVSIDKWNWRLIYCLRLACSDWLYKARINSVFRVEAANISFVDFGLTQLNPQPMIYQTRIENANDYTIDTA
jgi:hypothetical protein